MNGFMVGSEALFVRGAGFVLNKLRPPFQVANPPISLAFQIGLVLTLFSENQSQHH